VRISALTALTLAGGGYLVWLGAGTLRQPPPPTRPTAGPTAEPAPRTERGTFREGIGVSGLNPKGLLVFVALLPQFVSRQAPWPVALQLAMLGIAFTATCGGFYCALGTFARRVLRARAGTGQTLSRVSGAVMVVIGVLLVAERLLG
jgi:threonine/homoserine/homoserine lactone efflux protein